MADRMPRGGVTVNGHEHVVRNVDGNDVALAWRRDETRQRWELTAAMVSTSLAPPTAVLRTISDDQLANATVGPALDALYFYGHVTANHVRHAFGWPVPVEEPIQPWAGLPPSASGAIAGVLNTTDPPLVRRGGQRVQAKPDPPLVGQRKRRVIVADDED